MAKTNTQYSIIADVELELKNAQKQLNEFRKDNKLNLDLNVKGSKSLSDADGKVKKLDDSTRDLVFTYQQFRQVLDSVVDVTGKMVEQVKTLDAAQTEFKKVSELSGKALDAYQDKLSKAGKTVGRTGKPNRSEPVCTNGKCA